MTGIYTLTLKAPDGRERRTMMWFPDERFWQTFCEKARKNGISIVEEKRILAKCVE